MAAIQPAKESYFKTSVWMHAAHRTGWLLVLMLSATFTGLIISHYEAAFSAVPLLVSFIPMLMDTGGNCGSQSATLVIRGLAVEEIRFSDLFRVVWKEFRIALIISCNSFSRKRLAYFPDVPRPAAGAGCGALACGNRHFSEICGMCASASCKAD